MYTRIKSTVTGLATSLAALMLSASFGGAPSTPFALQPTQQADMIVVVLGSEADAGLASEAEQGKGGRRHMKRVLATPYLSVGRLLPRRGS